MALTFGGLRVLDRVSMTVERGADTLRLAPYQLPALGVARTFQHRWLDPDATVLENVLVGGHTRSRVGPLSLGLRLPFVRHDEARLRRRALELLEYVDLAGAAGRAAGSLPFGSAKRVEIARALLAEPRLLMLDEPASGVAHDQVDALAGLVRRLRAELGLTILLVEHHMGVVSAVTDKVVALVEGRKVAEGSAAQVRQDPAGAGKTTTLRAISGTVRRRGVVRFDGRDLTRLRPDQVARRGIAHVPQGRGTLPRLTAADNLMVGALRRRDRARVAADLGRCYDLFPRLAQRRAAVAGSLSGGEQQMLAIGRALMSRPRLLLLDEPSLGLAPRVTREVFRVIGELRAEWGLAMLLVEQSVAVALDTADTAVVLETGRVALRGPAAELAGVDAVRSAYLGS